MMMIESSSAWMTTTPFTQQQRQSRKPISSLASTTSTTIVTGVQGQPALNYEEDLRLTLQIIMDHTARSTTVSTEQFIQQVQKEQEIETATTPEVVVDVSIPYDAAALLAYETTDKAMSFDEYKIQYVEQAVADVIAKKQQKASSSSAAAASPEIVNDISVPYDAAALLAYETSAKTISFDDYKIQFVQAAVADVIAKKQKQQQTQVPTSPSAAAASSTSSKPEEVVVDISVPYDAAARLAYAKSSNRDTISFDDYNIEYVQAAVADVIAKNKKKQKSSTTVVSSTSSTTAVAVEENKVVNVVVDISIPYDAAARLAYATTGSTLSYPEFKLQYEMKAVADVIAKKAQK